MNKTVKDPVIDLCFPTFPHWTGVGKTAGVKNVLPFSLGWSQNGYIHQTTSGDIVKKVVDLYQSDEYEFITPAPGTSKLASARSEKKVTLVESFFGAVKDKTILEIGAGNLYLAQHFLGEGASEYLIVDPAIKNKDCDHKITIKRGYFKKEFYGNKKIDLLLSINCLEHVEDPTNFLLDIREVISKNKGKAFLAFPDIERQFIHGDLSCLIHEHLNYFTKKTIKNLLERCGLTILICENSLDCLDILVEAKGTPCFDGDIAMDETLPIAALAFHRTVSSLRDILEKAAHSNKNIAIHGASGGLNNALFLAGFSGAENIHIFDGDESKAGKYLPTCKNPILHAEDEKYQQFDEVLIAATTFYWEISDFLISHHGFTKKSIQPLFPMELTD